MCLISVTTLLLTLLGTLRQIPAYENNAIGADASQNPVTPSPSAMRMWITISAKRRFVEISWINAPIEPSDFVLLTTQKPFSFEWVKVTTGTPLAEIDAEGSGADYVPIDGYTSAPIEQHPAQHYWISNNGENDIVAAIRPTQKSEWFTTGVHFDYELSRNVTAWTSCYGYWASYINGTGHILASTCMRAYPRWMTDIRDSIADMRVRDLFLPGTHDSGSYRPNFHPLQHETVVTKYALTQDDDIRGQLMHGVRYLDIRVGYHRNTPEQFFINHGITRQVPLADVIQQVKDFVLETNEIVVFGLKEFPVGFKKTLAVHRLLVQFLKDHFGDVLAHPTSAWQTTFRDMWSRNENVILAYDRSLIVQEFPELLFGSVEQRWGNVKSWPRLERHLRAINTYDISRISSRPVADMAELTPDTWDVIFDKLGGLRKMADNVNWRVCELYRDELGSEANIVAVDFIRGTTLTEIAIEWNYKKLES